MNTLKHLLETGDQVRKIEGVLSGTLSYLFNTFDGTTPWSDIVKGARNLGYTEPDPRDDLSGTDVQRKVVILARECGLKVNMDDVPVDNLVPEPLRTANSDEFLERLSEFDDDMK